ncbi:YcaO-like family protein [Gordonia sp. L191]|uniref:YcaO-like family protein n=1 Tax=Gordonia sp. L191 TaxID=2982699 RepID=UPI0024C0641F|nr:YcaO-like family protein [Gordonia sp. L191]WHU46140.1 YcaO-like family protein [Gordonia sp. L191]
MSLPRHEGVDAQAVVVDLAAVDDPDSLRWAALRHWWSADHHRLPRRFAAGDDLEAEGAEALDVAALGLIDPDLLTEPGCPVTQPDTDIPRTWVAATRCRLSATEGAGYRSGWVPYTLAFPRGWDTEPGEPRDHPPFLAGLGAGRTHAAAVAEAWAGLAVEDALWRWWSGDRPQVVDASVPPHAQTAGLWADCPLTLTLQLLPTCLGGVVTLAAVDDSEIIAVGGGYGHDVRAQRTAIARALWQLVTARSLGEATSPMYCAGTSGLPPHRAERDYLCAAGPRHRRLLDPVAHVQLLLDPLVRNAVRERIGSPVLVTKTPGTHNEHGRAAALENLPHGYAWRVDLSPPEDATGCCVRFLVPGAATLPLGAFPPDPSVTATTRGALPFPGW